MRRGGSCTFTGGRNGVGAGLVEMGRACFESRVRWAGVPEGLAFLVEVFWVIVFFGKAEMVSF